MGPAESLAAVLDELQKRGLEAESVSVAGVEVRFRASVPAPPARDIPEPDPKAEQARLEALLFRSAG